MGKHVIRFRIPVIQGITSIKEKILRLHPFLVRQLIEILPYHLISQLNIPRFHLQQGILVHQFWGPFSFFITTSQPFRRPLGINSFTNLIDKFLRRTSPGCSINLRPVRSQNHKRRVSPHLIFLRQLHSFPFLRIHFHIHEHPVKIGPDLLLRKHLGRHHLTRSAPRRVEVNKYHLFLFPRKSQSLLHRQLLKIYPLGKR